MKANLKVGDMAYYIGEEGERCFIGPIEFIGTGKDSVKFEPRYPHYRSITDYVVVWDTFGDFPSWIPLNQCHVLTPLDKLL